MLDKLQHGTLNQRHSVVLGIVFHVELLSQAEIQFRDWHSVDRLDRPSFQQNNSKFHDLLYALMWFSMNCRCIRSHLEFKWKFFHWKFNVSEFIIIWDLICVKLYAIDNEWLPIWLFVMTNRRTIFILDFLPFFSLHCVLRLCQCPM